MIRIGLSNRQKQKVVGEYLKTHKIKKIFCFYFKRFPLEIKTKHEIEYIQYENIIEYNPFYRLLEEINETSLIIMNECMRTQNRSNLTYNCAHHYLRQTPHKIVFEYFPIIDRMNDFMILLDFLNKGKYKGKGFDYSFLQGEDIKIRHRKIEMVPSPINVTDKNKQRYKKKRDSLFDNLGNRDPDIIPRHLQIFAGNLKRGALNPYQNQKYVARNKRFNLHNVFSYQEIDGPGDYIVIDTHYRRLDMNDFLKVTEMNTIKYLNTKLTIDNYIVDEFARWKERCEAIYVQASVYQ